VPVGDVLGDVLGEVLGDMLGDVLGDGEQDVSSRAGGPAGEPGWTAPARPARPTTATGTATNGIQIRARDRRFRTGPDGACMMAFPPCQNCSDS
jgi:hypothetical protein